MKKILLGLLFVTSFGALSAFANEDETENVADVFFEQVKVDSVEVISGGELLSEDHYKVAISFRILPSDSCQANFAGLFKKGFNDYMAVYGASATAACKRFAQPRVIKHRMLINFQPYGGEGKFTLNGVTYRVVRTENGLKIL